MTREEAIKIINCYDIGFYDLSGEKIPADKLAEAFDMAIEVLSVKDCHGCTHYDLLQTPLICHDCSRAYKDRYKDEKGTLDDMFAESAEAYKAWTGEEMGGGRLIDKHLLMEELQKSTEKETSPTIRAGLIEAQRITLNAQIVSADRPHGEWKCMADCGVTECDQCGWSIEEYVGDYNYCPNCGADMRGGDGE